MFLFRFHVLKTKLFFFILHLIIILLLILDLQRSYPDENTEYDRTIHESPSPVKHSNMRSKKGSINKTNPANETVTNDFLDNPEEHKDDKRKRGKSPFR